MKERYAFVFEYENDWMIVLYENGINVKYFNSAENDWDDSLDYVALFLESGGNRYWYNLPSYNYIENLNIFELENHPIKDFEEYLLKTDSLDEPF